jgi:hypothetical protein
MSKVDDTPLHAPAPLSSDVRRGGSAEEDGLRRRPQAGGEDHLCPRPAFGVECKAGERAVSPAIRYFAARTPIPRFYQVHLGQRHFETGTVTVLPFERFCADLDLP